MSDKALGALTRFKGVALVDGKVVCEATMMCARSREAYPVQQHQERLTLRVSSRLGSRLSAIAKQHAISKNQLIVDVLEREFA
jgi:predicted HicB family RNase H-like nuclease